MNFPEPQKLKDLASYLGCAYRGDGDHLVLGYNEIHRVREGDLVFVDHPKYYQVALESAATTILINQEVAVPEGKGILVSEDPFRDFNRIAQKIFPFRASSALIDPSAEVGTGSQILPGAVIGAGVKIGKNCIIHSNVTILERCELGDNVVVQANSVIGSHGFYYKNRPEGFDRLLSTGTVVLEDDVEIGASCTIDRGVTADTRIGAGSKLDNGIHVGHDTLIGKKCLIAAQTAIAGCCVLEDEVVLWGQVGISANITIGTKAIVLAQSGVTKNLKAGKTYFGYPADEARKRQRELASLRLLPEIINHIEIER